MKKIYKPSEDACQRFIKSVKYSTGEKISKKVLKETMTTLSNVEAISKVANVSNIISPYFSFLEDSHIAKGDHTSKVLLMLESKP